MLVVLEGHHDIQFLQRAAAVLRLDDNKLPELSNLERCGQIVFVPFCGDVRGWAFRLAELGRPEFHLYDREDTPATEVRLEMARVVNLRIGCRAEVMSKRSLENYLHPDAILEARGIDVRFSDGDDVADRVAEQCYLRNHPDDRWIDLPARSRRRLRNRVKSWLNTLTVERMTVARFAERNLAGEIRGWLQIIAEMTDSAS
ncbi:MAG TPA: ATP-dependent endonuclease [Pirellulales bacterium]|nr:ATP-dependent endonuclease [Pirellulales bacterium]